jgi:hypothetical protein
MNIAIFIFDSLVLPKCFFESLISGYAIGSKFMKSLFSFVCTGYTCTISCIWALYLLSIFWASGYTKSLLGKILHISKINEGSVGQIEIALFTFALYWIVHLIEMFWINKIIRLLNAAHAIMKRVRAKIAAMIVQKQSVHFLYF